MRICANNRVRIEDTFGVENDSGKILKVNLMNDSRTWRNSQEVIEGTLAPLQELESFLVSFKFELLVSFSGVSGSCNIDLNGMIDNKINWAERVDLLRITSKSFHGVSHSCEINDSWHTSEVLENDSCRLERNLEILLRAFPPVQDGFDVSL